MRCKILFLDIRQKIALKVSDGSTEDFLKTYNVLSDLPNFSSNLLGAAQAAGGYGQVVLGGGICEFSLGTGCILGATLVAYGVNNIYEGTFATFGVSVSGPARGFWRAALGKENGDIAYLGTDFLLGSYDFFRPTRVPADLSSYTITRNPNKIIPAKPSYLRPAFNSLSGVEAGVDTVNYLNSVDSIKDELN